MNLSEKDRARLDELAALRDAGDITNDEYQRLCWATIRERGIKRGDYTEEAFLEAAKEDEVFRPEDPNTKSSAAPSVAALTTCTPSRMQQYHRAQRYSKRNTGVTNHLAMNKLLRRFSGGRTTSGHAMMFPKRRIRPVLALTVLIATVIATIYLGKYKGERLGEREQREGLLEGSDGYRFIIPFFGPQAVGRCQRHCSQTRSGEDQLFCEKGCRYYSLANYGRRISLRPEQLGFEHDLKAIKAQCIDSDIDGEAHRLDDEWKTRIEEALQAVHTANASSTIGNFKAARARYQELLKVNKLLMMPPSRDPEQSELTRAVIRATCLRAHLTLTEMALGIVKTRSDKFSEDYYAALWRSLEEKTNALEKNVLRNKTAKKLLTPEKEAA